jgi:hypothetical protein
MNTRQKARQGILFFLQKDEKFLLLTGTYQNEKHVLALSIILSDYPAFFAYHSLTNLSTWPSSIFKVYTQDNTLNKNI